MEYIPGAPVNDEAKKANQNLPGMGGVFNVVNFHLYHYAGNNPVKYTNPDGRSLWGQIVFTIKNPRAGFAIGWPIDGGKNISSVATNFTINSNLAWANYGTAPMDQGSKRGAFRHTLWQALVTSKFGQDIAYSIGEAHENVPLTIGVTFATLEDADAYADRLNNGIGRRIGEEKDSSPLNMAKTVLKEFHENGLFTVNKNDEGTFSIQKKKLTEVEYKEALSKINNLNDQGRLK